jgi:hypothetical protein
VTATTPTPDPTTAPALTIATADQLTTSAAPARRANVRRAELQPLVDAYTDAVAGLESSGATRAAANAMVLVVRYLERALDDAAHRVDVTPTGRPRKARAARTGR